MAKSTESASEHVPEEFQEGTSTASPARELTELRAHQGSIVMKAEEFWVAGSHGLGFFLETEPWDGSGFVVSR